MWGCSFFHAHYPDMRSLLGGRKDEFINWKANAESTLRISVTKA